MATRTSPLQNRVTPFSELVATPEHGMFMGNRGCLHNERQEITRRRWTTTRWITCLTEFKDRHRVVMQPGRYTELFFLDEATAFAAGHRPCAECRRADYNRFMELWRAAHDLDHRAPAEEVDAMLQFERVTADRTQKRWQSRLGDLPDGTFVSTREGPETALLSWEGRLLVWSMGGYAESLVANVDETVDVLTPPSITKVFAAGYRPVVHPSA